MTGARCRIGVDVGGTFTDLIAAPEDGGGLIPVKLLSTPRSPADGVIDALTRFLGGNDANASYLVHASTIGTNLFLGQMGLTLPRTALVCTEGFRDVLEIGRQRRAELYNLFYQRPRALVDRRHRIGIPERIDWEGRVVRPLDEESVRAAGRRLAAEGVEAVAIAFLHSYANPAHERRAKALLAEILPQAVVIASSEVDPEYREYERTSTTVVNAVLSPVVSRYLRSLAHRLPQGMSGTPLYAMQSSGGITTIEGAAATPGAVIESGPAAGVVGAAAFARTLGLARALSFDMGGTTAKAGAVIDGRPEVVTEYEVGGVVHAGRIVRGSGYPVRSPFIDLAEVSAGGGTVAWVDDAALRCGPVSAGADPGPACYGLGGDRPTVTDAHLALGLLSPEGLLGGRMGLSRSAAERALKTVAGPLGLELTAAAAGILEVVNAQMARALRIVSLERGHDPREMVMVAFGGAGPMHAAALADDLGIREVVIPATPGLFSAVGLLAADLRCDRVESVMRPLAHVDGAWLETRFRHLDAEARQAVQDGDGRRRVVVQRGLDLRYIGQSYELTVPGEVGVEKAAEAFRARHADIYGYAPAQEPVEVVNVRVTAFGIMPSLAFEAARAASPSAHAPQTRQAYLAGRWEEVPVLTRSALEPGRHVAGPAIVEESDATTVVPPGWSVRAEQAGTLRMRRTRM
ncbi:MAG TPA: hydantoinase/oxoprolinase family protein [bacterium]|nr:hydantoinase/oxoprolinase family protein [bacterium]